MKLFSNKYRIIITLISTMLIGGCDFKELAEGEIASTIYESIKVDKTDLNFKDLERTKSVIITANCKWTITNCPKWIHPIPTSGNSGERVVEIRVDEPVDTVRSATIHIEGDLLTRELFIKQDGRFIFDVRPLSLDFSSDGGADSLHIDCNTSWEIKNQTSWCHLPTTRGTGNKTLTITCKENTTNADRYDIISVSVQDSIIKIPVLQSGGRFYITIIDDHINIDKDGGSKTIYVQSNIDWLFKRHPANGVSVATVKPINNNEVSFTVENNPYPVERYDTIVFYGEKYPHVTDTVYIRQSPQPAYLKINGSESTITQSFTNVGGSKTFSIESNSEWKAEVKEGSTWCRISSPTDKAGPGNGNLTLSIDTNPIGSQARTAIIQVTTTSGSPKVERTITVTQEKGTDPILRIQDNEDVLEFNAMGETRTLTIESNIDWKIAGAPDWCEVSPTESTGTKTVTLTAKKNTASSTRSSTLTISASSAYPNVPLITITLNQGTLDIPGGNDNPDPYYSRKH